jgi:ankyrin repeat protein
LILIAPPQHGANVNANGQCEAHIPDFRQCVTTITFDTLCLNRNNLTPLHVSVSKNDKKMVPLLLEHGADVNATNKCDQSAAAFDIVKNVHIYEFTGGVERRCMRRH